jgi:glycosyltransferase involved in cell wall biosynthesis
MKVLHIININAIGGAEKLLLQLLPALDKKVKVECAVYYPRNSGAAALQIAEGLKNTGIPVYTFPYYKLYDRKIFSNLLSQINNGNYTLIHSHLKYADGWLAWLKFRKKITLPVVSTMHGYNDKYENAFGFTVSKRLFFSYYFQVSKWVFRQLDGFILISNIVSEFFNKTGLIKNKQQVVIYHGYEKPGLPAGGLFKKNNKGDFRLALPGRLIKRKGHRYAIEALEKLKGHYPGISLHIYGDGPDREVLQQIVAEKDLNQHIFFHGYVNDLVNRLKEMDIVLIPSLWEGFGLVFLDAFAAGVPVVAFDLPAANEIIRDGYNGLLAAPNSSGDLAENILKLYKNPELSEKIANHAFAELQTKFSIDSMTDNYMSFYKRFM